MPELPEVETIASQLDIALKGKQITSIETLNPGSFSGNAKSIIGISIVKVTRKAKTLVIIFGDNLFALIHLKMTGQLILVGEDRRIAGGHPSHDFHAKLPNTHTRVVFTFNDGSILYFNDLRKFGWVKVMNKEAYNHYFMKLGPDATPSIDIKYLNTRAARMPRSSIKKFILDQSVIAGVGNIYADESLFDAKIAPDRLVCDISEAELESLGKIISDKLIFATEKGGTTDSDYVNAYGEKGGMQDYLNVYHKAGEPCPNNCGGVIVRTTVAGRGTHFCPNCQRKKK